MLILGLILFVMLVVVHEFGHFLAAKKNGVEVEEFGIGFPPKVYGKTLGKGLLKSYYSINLLPLGGFVKLKGEHDADKSKGAFGSVGLKAKLKIIFAGVFLNLLLAVIMLTVVAWLGMPQLVENQFNIKSDYTIIDSKLIINYVGEKSPAEKTGLRTGDVIVSVNGQKIDTQEQLKALTQKYASQNVLIEYRRDGELMRAKTQLLSVEEVEASQKTDNPKAHLGVSTSKFELARSTWSGPIVAVVDTAQFSWLTIKGIGGALANLVQSAGSFIVGDDQQAKQEASAAGENVSGPVGIYFILRQGSVLGYQFILFIIAIISLTLAIINALPIPALDGGRAFVILLFRGLKKPLDAKTEDLIHGSGFAFLMILFLVITIVDVKRFF